jgi:hypothetical protein
MSHLEHENLHLQILKIGLNVNAQNVEKMQKERQIQCRNGHDHRGII